MNEIVPREQLVKSGLKGFLAVGGGIGLLVLKALSSLPIVGVVVGAALAIGGIAMSASKEDKPAGVVTLVAGALTAGAALIPGFRWLMSLAGWGLLIGGAVSLYKFFSKLKKRM